MSEMTSVKLQYETERELETVKGAADRGAEIVRTLRAEIARIESDETISESHRAELVAEARGEAQTQVNDLRSKVSLATSTIQGKVRQISAAPSDTNEALLREQQIGRGWNRVRGQLDGGGDINDVIRVAAAEGDRHALTAIREEYPAYLRAGGTEHADELLEGTRELLSRAETPFLSRVEADARDLTAELDRRLPFVEMSINSVASEAAGGGEVPVLARTQTDLIDLKDAA